MERLTLARTKPSRLARTAIYIAILVAANLLLAARTGAVHTETNLLAKLKKSNAYAAGDAYTSEAGSQAAPPFDGDGPQAGRTGGRAATRQMTGKNSKTSGPRKGSKNVREKGASYPRTYRPSLDLRYDD